MKRALFVVFACLALIGPARRPGQTQFRRHLEAVRPGHAGSVHAERDDRGSGRHGADGATISQMGEFKTSYKLDGTEAPSPMNFNGMTIDRMTKLVWERKKLLLVTTSKMEGQSIEFKSAWSLTADGSLLTETTFPDFQGGGPPITMKATYRGLTRVWYSRRRGANRRRLLHHHHGDRCAAVLADRVVLNDVEARHQVRQRSTLTMSAASWPASNFRVVQLVDVHAEPLRPVARISRIPDGEGA